MRCTPRLLGHRITVTISSCRVTTNPGNIPRECSDAALVNRIAHPIKNRYLYPAEIELVAPGPVNRADACRLQVQGQYGLRSCCTIGRNFIGGRPVCFHLYSGLPDVLVNPLHDLPLERICPGEIFLQVWGQDDLLALGSLHMSEQNHPLPDKAVKVDIAPMVA